MGEAYAGQEEDAVGPEAGQTPGSNRQADTSRGALTLRGSVALPTGVPCPCRVGRDCRAVPSRAFRLLLPQPPLRRGARPAFITLPVYFSRPNIL